MGADNISIIAVLPARIKPANIKKALYFLSQARRFLDVCNSSVDDNHAFFETLSSVTDRDDMRIAVQKLRQVCGVKLHKADVERITEAWFRSEDSFENLSVPEFTADILSGLGKGYRDSAVRLVTIGGKLYDIVSAGEMTWGDEPEGEGYTELKQAYRWGIVNMLGGV